MKIFLVESYSNDSQNPFWQEGIFSSKEKAIEYIKQYAVYPCKISVFEVDDPGWKSGQSWRKVIYIRNDKEADERLHRGERI